MKWGEQYVSITSNIRCIFSDVAYVLQKVKDGLEFVLGAKKKQVILDAYFQKKWFCMYS